MLKWYFLLQSTIYSKLFTIIDIFKILTCDIIVSTTTISCMYMYSLLGWYRDGNVEIICETLKLSSSVKLTNTNSI